MATYQEAWERMMSVYDDPYKIAQSYMRRLYQLPVLQSPASADDLKRMSDVTNETIRQLRALGLPVDSWDFVFVHNLHERLENETGRLWQRARASGVLATATEMIDFLDREAAAARPINESREQLQISVHNIDGTQRWRISKKAAV